jgi:hypothetical protein
MKNIFFLCLIIAGITSNPLLAQPSETVAKEKMKPFTHWIGRWQGEGSMQMGPGQPKKSTVDEHIVFKLDGAVLLVEGIGKSIEAQPNDGKVVHHALAVLSFDQTTSQYKFNSYLKDGRSTQAWFNIIGENNYEWGFDAPTGKIKYRITIDPATKTWNEIGQFSNDQGSTWMKFFEMNLKRLEN